VVKKKSDSWVATITTTSAQQQALAASLACEDGECTTLESDSIRVKVMGDSASDLRARFNSTMRSLRAASEALSSIE